MIIVWYFLAIIYIESRAHEIECDPPCVNGVCGGNRFEDVERTFQCFSGWTGSDCSESNFLLY